MSQSPPNPDALTSPSLVAKRANDCGQQLAVRDGDTDISYQQLDAWRGQAAKACLAVGVGHGDRVAIWAPNVWEWIAAALGAQSVGAILVPLNVRLQGAEAADILRRSGARLLFTCEALEKGAPLDLLAGEALPELTQTVLFRHDDERARTWDEFLAGASQIDHKALADAEAAVQPDDTADMLFTSGTTGKPKGVLCSHRQNLQCFTIWSDTVGLRADDRYLIVNPFFHSFGYKAGWLAAIIAGCSIYPMRSFEKRALMEAIQTHRITMLPGAPSLYEMILADEHLKDYDLSSLRLGVTGAAAVPVSLVEAMRNELGFETVVTAYGLTESTGVTTICRPEDDAETIATTSGRAMPGIECKCAHPETGDEVPRGSEGEVWVRGFNVMQGYFDMPEATAKTITEDGWLRTGDIGVMDERGYLRITDRLKDMYIMNGENVYPAEVEKCLFACEGVAQVAVIGVPKAPQGEVGMAFVVRNHGSTLSEDDIKQYAAEHLARYKCPYYVRFIDALPLNAAGKVVKPTLKARAKEELGFE